MLGTFITLNGTEVILRLDKLGGEFNTRLAAEAHELMEELLGRILAAEPVRTGRLQSQTRASFRDTDSRIAGIIRPGWRRADAAKAAALEYGAHGIATVSEYERASGVVVAAYQRHVNIAAIHFLRDPFEAMQPEIDERLRAVVDDMMSEADA